MTVKKFSGVEHISPFSNVFHTQNVFQKVERGSKKAGFSPKDVLNEAVRMNVSMRNTETDGKRSAHLRRINGKQVRCIAVIFRDNGDDLDSDELPF